jgi:hypothetical protein
MAATNTQFGLFTYLDDNGHAWNVRCDKAWGANTDSGLTAPVTDQPRFEYKSRRYHPRYAILTDLTTGRSTRKVCGTPTAAAYATAGYTHAETEPGIAATVTYTRTGRYAEKQPQDKSAPNIPLHA